MTDTPKKRALVVSSFDDEGTGESFAKGATPLIDAGSYANYEAAGLITASPAAKATAKPKGTATKPRAKPKSKPKTTVAPAPAPEPIPDEQPEASIADDITAAAD